MTINSPTRLYKDRRNAKWMGVCSGIADYFGMKPGAVRLLMILAAFMTSFIPVLFIYLILGFSLDNKPEDLYEDDKEEEFWRDTRKSPEYSTAEMRRRFRDVERRTADMEAYMTSKKFKLERELNNL